MPKVTSLSKIALVILGLLIACPVFCLPSGKVADSCHQTKKAPDNDRQLAKACCKYEGILSSKTVLSVSSIHRDLDYSVNSPGIHPVSDRSIVSAHYGRELLSSISVLRI